MLNGIGGRTIAEAKQNMSFGEVQHWADYRRRHGGLNIVERVEQSAALICSTVLRSVGNKNSKVADFIPNRESDDELRYATPQDFMKILQASRKQ